MLRISLLNFSFFFIHQLFSQSLTPLTVEKIMRDPKWMGTSPSGIQWSSDGEKLFFNWNPDKAPADSLYYITLTNRNPVKASALEKKSLEVQAGYVYNEARTAYLFVKEGDVFYTDIKTGKTKRIIQTTDIESSPRFSFNESKIVYTRGQNLYAWDIVTGETIQLSNTKSSDSQGASAGTRGGTPVLNQQEQWLKNDQLQFFQVLKERKEKRDATEAYNKNLPKEKELRSIPLDDKSLQGLAISPDGRYISYRLFKAAPSSGAKTTIVPSYVTETGFTTDIPSRPKVGAQQGSSEFFIYDRVRDTIIALKTDSIPGIQDLPDYLADYP
jgi:Tol biopolymer transport system component